MAGARGFERRLAARLQAGEHLFLYGPRGMGKSTLVGRLQRHFQAAGMPCGLSTATAHLCDLTQAMERAYSGVDTGGIDRRRARGRLVMAADRRPGVLLLDGVTAIGTAMCGFLRRLRRTGVAVLLVADVEVPRELGRLREWYYGTYRIAMPAAATATLRHLLRRAAPPAIAAEEERRILKAARGRPGWVLECAHRAAQPQYWRGEVLLVETLCMDTEISLRQGELALLPKLNTTMRAVPGGQR